MKCGLNKKQAQEYAKNYGLILDGFVVEQDHAMLLCEQGKEYTYSKKKQENQEEDNERRAKY